MGLWEQFPYANMHSLNVDWVLTTINTLNSQITAALVDVRSALADFSAYKREMNQEWSEYRIAVNQQLQQFSAEMAVWRVFFDQAVQQWQTITTQWQEIYTQWQQILLKWQEIEIILESIPEPDMIVMPDMSVSLLHLPSGSVDIYQPLTDNKAVMWPIREGNQIKKRGRVHIAVKVISGTTMQYKNCNAIITPASGYVFAERSATIERLFPICSEDTALEGYTRDVAYMNSANCSVPAGGGSLSLQPIIDLNMALTPFTLSADMVYVVSVELKEV